MFNSGFKVMANPKPYDLDLAFEGHKRSNVMSLVESLHYFLYMSNSNDMHSMPCFKVKAHSKPCDLDFTFQGHQRSNLMTILESSYMTSYTCLIVIICLRCFVSKLWPHDVDLTIEGQQEVKFNVTNRKLLYEFLDMSNSNDMPSMLCFKVMGNEKSHDLDLTIQGHQRSNLLSLLESCYMTSYTCLIVMICTACFVSKLWVIKIHVNLI